MYREIADDKLIHILKDLGLDKFANPDSLDELIITEDGANYLMSLWQILTMLLPPR